MTDQPVKTGDIVLFRHAASTMPEAYRVPAIVVVTHEDWVPGYHDKDGTWVPTPAKMPQPPKGAVHLTAFGISGEGKSDVWHQQNAQEGEGPGQFKRRP